MNTNNPPARDGESLNWIVVNPDGKLLAIVDSESEAHYFAQGRGHASGSVYFKAPVDYAAAPDLLKALESFLRAPSIGSNGPGSSTIVVQDFNLRDARAAIARATVAQAETPPAPAFDAAAIAASVPSEDEGIKLLNELMGRYDWSGTIFTRIDAATQWDSNAEDDSLPSMTDEDWDRVRDTRAWSREMPQRLTEQGWTFVDEAVREVMDENKNPSTT